MLQRVVEAAVHVLGVSLYIFTYVYRRYAYSSPTAHMYTPKHMSICMHAYIYVYMHIYMYIYTYVLGVSTYIFTYLYITSVYRHYAYSSCYAHMYTCAVYIYIFVGSCVVNMYICVVT